MLEAQKDKKWFQRSNGLIIVPKGLEKKMPFGCEEKENLDEARTIEKIQRNYYGTTIH